jgi:hypothetical protein
VPYFRARASSPRKTAGHTTSNPGRSATLRQSLLFRSLHMDEIVVCGFRPSRDRCGSKGLAMIGRVVDQVGTAVLTGCTIFRGPLTSSAALRLPGALAG